jgi:hypothetical protein
MNDSSPPAQPAALFRAWGMAWLALTAALALHVADEAVNDFLAVYNPTVRAIRARLPFLPLPTFTFAVWLSGLIAAIAILAVLSPLAFRGRPELRYLAYPYAAIMLLNGLQHIAGSVWMGRLMPGVISAPLLIVTSAILLFTTRRAVPGRRRGV